VYLGLKNRFPVPPGVQILLIIFLNFHLALKTEKYLK